jgi:hypothetical protein
MKIDKHIAKRLRIPIDGMEQFNIIRHQDTPTWRIELDLGQGVVIRIR